MDQKGKVHVKNDTLIPPEILDDLSSRFIINVPKGEKKDLIRVLFQIELAHWFYLDFYCKNQRELKTCSMREFTLAIFKHIPFLNPYIEDLDRIIDEWKDYKFFVPTYGGILLDETLTHVLLVQSYWSKSSWGFPKGKVNKDESPWHCAIREVYEETGFNISHLIDQNKYIEAYIHDQLIRLYIIPGVSKDITFQPRTRNEIKAVKWFLINDLPVSKKDASLKLKTGISTSAFYMVIPFIKKLKLWIVEQCQDPFRTLRRHRYKSCSDIEGVFSSLSENNDKKERSTPERKKQVISKISRSTQSEIPAPRLQNSLITGESSAILSSKLGVIPSEGGRVARTRKRVSVISKFSLGKNLTQNTMPNNIQLQTKNGEKKDTPVLTDSKKCSEKSLLLDMKSKTNMNKLRLSVDKDQKVLIPKINEKKSEIIKVNDSSEDTSPKSSHLMHNMSSFSFLSEKNMENLAEYIAKLLYLFNFEFQYKYKKPLLKIIQKKLTCDKSKMLVASSWVIEVLLLIDECTKEDDSLEEQNCKEVNNEENCLNQHTGELPSQSKKSKSEECKSFDVVNRIEIKSWKNFKFDIDRICKNI